MGTQTMATAATETGLGSKQLVPFSEAIKVPRAVLIDFGLSVKEREFEKHHQQQSWRRVKATGASMLSEGARNDVQKLQMSRRIQSDAGDLDTSSNGMELVMDLSSPDAMDMSSSRYAMDLSAVGCRAYVAPEVLRQATPTARKTSSFMVLAGATPTSSSSIDVEQRDTSRSLDAGDATAPRAIIAPLTSSYGLVADAFSFGVLLREVLTGDRKSVV